MSKRHWEDFKPGAVAVYGPRLVTREEIVAFAAEFDPQPMHLDEAAGATTLLGGLAASGWHSCCILMRMIADGFINEFEFLGRTGRGRSTLAEAAAARHPSARADDRDGNACFEQPVRDRLRQMPVRADRRARHRTDYDDEPADAQTPRGWSAAVKYFEDIAVGERTAVGRHTFTADDIKAFATRFDPQPFHVDEKAAERSHFGRLAASGWHSAVIWMRMMVAERRRQAEAARSRGEPVAAMGPALGLRDLKWLKPVYVDDTITYESEVIEARFSESRPNLGLLTVRSTGLNQTRRTRDIL